MMGAAQRMAVKFDLSPLTYQPTRARVLWPTTPNFGGTMQQKQMIFNEIEDITQYFQKLLQ